MNALKILDRIMPVIAETAREAYNRALDDLTEDIARIEKVAKEAANADAGFIEYHRGEWNVAHKIMNLVERRRL